MAAGYDTYQKKRVLSSYFWVVVSIFLVLFLLGLQGLFVLNAKKIGDYFKEQIALTVYFTDEANDVEMKQLEKALAFANYSKSATFVSADTAAEKHQEELGENFVEFLGENPLHNSIDVYLNADFVDNAQVEKIADDLAAKDYVEEVTYDKPLINLLNDNVKTISFWVLVISGILVLIAVLLINSSIRLAVYSQRFIIKTMQMVGATKGFIRRPFVWRGVRLGIIGAILATIGVGLTLYFIDKSWPQLELMKDYSSLAILVGGIFLMGIFITWLSTWMATQRFLNLKTDALYY